MVDASTFLQLKDLAACTGSALSLLVTDRLLAASRLLPIWKTPPVLLCYPFVSPLPGPPTHTGSLGLMTGMVGHHYHLKKGMKAASWEHWALGGLIVLNQLLFDLSGFIYLLI